MPKTKTPRSGSITTNTKTGKTTVRSSKNRGRKKVASTTANERRMVGDKNRGRHKAAVKAAKKTGKKYVTTRAKAVRPK